MKKIMLFCALAISCNVVWAEQASQQMLIETVIDAKPIKRKPPYYPRSAARSGKEGWVVMSYVVEPDGSVSYPIIESSSGVKSLERSALRSVKQWQYQPATRDGKAIQQCKTTVRLDFALGNKSQGASKRFIRKYKKIAKLIATKELEQATVDLAKLRDSPKWNLYEDAWSWQLQADLHAAAGNEEQELMSLNRIIGNSTDYLPKNNYLNALSRIFALDLKFNRFAYALATFERIKAIDNENKLIAEFQPYVDKINNLVNSDTPIVINGEMLNNEFWQHQLIRHSFGFDSIEGSLYKMDVRCNNKRTTFRVAEQKVWNIPKSWGQCTLYVYGEDNSNFKLVEIANKQPGEA